MQSSPSITYRGIAGSEAINEIIHRRIDELEKFHSRIIGCDVVIDSPQKRQVHGRGFEVHVQLHLPGPDISGKSLVGQSNAADDLKLAVNKAFSAVEKQLKEQKRKMGRQEVKHHNQILHGKILDVIGPEGYGFLKADDGREFYFQRDSFESGDWETLKVGDQLRFRAEMGEKGPFAVNIAVV